LTGQWAWARAWLFREIMEGSVSNLPKTPAFCKSAAGSAAQPFLDLGDTSVSAVQSTEPAN